MKNYVAMVPERYGSRLRGTDPGHIGDTVLVRFGGDRAELGAPR
jgi:hypothetical protein